LKSILIDLSVEVKLDKWKDIFRNEKMTSLGHLATHFDVLDREFQLANTRRRGQLVDVRGIRDRDSKARDLEAAGSEAAGIRRGAEHTPTDRHCADHGVFIVENLANPDLLLERARGGAFEGMSGLPCRAIAELREGAEK
jgi:hypothetical protein